MEQGNLKIDKTWHRECAYAYFWENVHGIGARTIEKLYERYQGYEKMYQVTVYEGVKDAQKQAIAKEKEKWNVEKEYERLLTDRIWCVPRHLAGYPKKLAEIANAPSAVFVKGKLPTDSKPSVAIVGARNCSPYGKVIAKELGKQLAQSGVQVVSGLARGIDGISQQAVFENMGATFGILGCGVNVCYPKENAALYEKLATGINGSGIMSEFLPGTEPKANYFPMRNRIISALSDALVVVEAKEKSGTFITVSNALEQGKDVYAVPGRIGDSLSVGCNRLICQGAEILYDMEHLIETICEQAAYKRIRQESVGVINEARRNNKLNEMENRIWELLDIQYMSIDRILDSVKMKNMPVNELLIVLSGLECKGMIEAEGNFYRKKTNLLDLK